ncbi:hypothetical protein I549_4388 [Mycobacterium avium subsp. avium 2285 (R)]|nr:hypothetical protein I549_4388 [Mycobacterium avium subsp. avium 2285 (R)]
MASDAFVASAQITEPLVAACDGDDVCARSVQDSREAFAESARSAGDDGGSATEREQFFDGY